MKQLLLVTVFFSLFIPSHSKGSDTLIVGYKESAPFIYEEEGVLVGPSVWLWEKIAKENNLVFTYQKQTLDSLLKNLHDNSIDICLAPLTITSKRAKSIDFSYPFFTAHSTLMKKSTTTLEKTVGFIKSFFSSNFLKACGALVFVILIFGLMVWIFERKKNKEEFGHGIKGLWNGFWWSAVTMTTVGYGDKSPQTVGGRAVALIWMFTAIIIISGFTASIASSLTVNKIDTSSGSIKDYKEKSIGTITKADTDEWLKNNFYKNKKSYQDMESLLEGLNKGEIKAIAYDKPILANITAHDSTDQYTLVETKFNPQYYALGISKALNDTLEENINLSMLNLIEGMEWKVLLTEYNLE